VSFIFSVASVSLKLRRPNPPVLTYIGYILCGITGGASLILFAHAATSAAGMPLLTLTI